MIILAASKKETVRIKCMKGHLMEVTEDILLLNKTESAFSVKCPVCSAPGAISWKEVAQVMGVEQSDKATVIAQYKARHAKGEPVVSDDTSGPAPGISEPEDTGEGADDDDTGEEVTTMDSEDGEGQGGDGSIYTEPAPVRTVMPAPAPAAAPVRRVFRSPAATQAPQGAQRRGTVLLDEETADITPKDILLAVIEDMGLPPVETGQMCEWVRLSVGTEWDPDAVKKFCEQFGLSSTVTAKITNRFRNQLELRRLKKRQQEGLMAITDRVGAAAPAMPGSPGYMGPVVHGVGATAMPQMAGVPVLQTQVQSDPCAAAVQAIINAAGGVITPQTLQQIDAVRAAFGQATGGGAAPGGAMSPMQAIQMFKDMQEVTERKKQSDEERNKEKAEIDKRFTDMQTAMQQSMQQLMMVITANKQPAVPVESEHTKVLDALLTIVKDKNTPPPVPVVPAGKTRDDQIFDQVFGLMLENMKNKPNETVAPIQAKLDSLEEQISRIGGGFAGLPTNSDQLRGIIDYTKAMADIKKTENEFADKKANRDMISTIAQTAFQSIGEAAASVFMQNPGTPQEKPVDLKEQPIDDGSVVMVMCPDCGIPMSAPKNSPKIKCPNCGAEFGRVKQEITREQAVEAEKRFLEKVEAEQAAANQIAVPAQPSQVETAKTAPVRLPTTPTPILGPNAPQVDAGGKEIGPMSRMILDSAPVVDPKYVPTVVEQPPALVVEIPGVVPPVPLPIPSIQPATMETRTEEPADAVSVKDISVSDEDSSEE